MATASLMTNRRFLPDFRPESTIYPGLASYPFNNAMSRPADENLSMNHRPRHGHGHGHGHGGGLGGGGSELSDYFGSWNPTCGGGNNNDGMKSDPSSPAHHCPPPCAVSTTGAAGAVIPAGTTTMTTTAAMPEISFPNMEFPGPVVAAKQGRG